MFTPENAIAIGSWFSEKSDTELLDLIPFLEDIAKDASVYTKLATR